MKQTTIVKKSISSTGKYWLTVSLELGGFISYRLAQVTEALFNSHEIGAKLAVPEEALREIGE